MKRNTAVKRRKQDFAERLTTRIWQEESLEENPYLATTCRLHGYDLRDLMENCKYPQILFLLFKGELPTAEQARLLESIQIALINPGPRHSATRAAINAGTGKTDPAHILPIGLSILGGSHLGATEVEGAMRFLSANVSKDVDTVVEHLQNQVPAPDYEGDIHLAPGFGSRFGNADPWANKMAQTFSKLHGELPALFWGQQFSDRLARLNMGWLMTGLAAAVFTDLGFQPRVGIGLFQLLCAPGLLAHGLEYYAKPISAMPFIKDEDYVIE